MSEKYALVAAEQAEQSSPYSVALMCRLLQVSRAGYYESQTGGVSARAARRAKLAACVQAAFTAGRGVYGVRRVHATLACSDDPQVAGVSLRLVRALMRELGLRAAQPRAYRVTTVCDPDASPAVVDHLDRDFTAPAPGTKLVGDITYIKTWEGWLYLATVIDCATKQVSGWSMATHMRTSLICDAITMAASRTALQPDAVFHSDRGTQYTSREFAAHLQDLGVTGSMGRTGVCWDNAMAESFFAALKNELVHRMVFATRDTARRAIAEYIEVFYNRQRLHSGLGYKTPDEVATAYQQNHVIAA